MIQAISNDQSDDNKTRWDHLQIHETNLYSFTAQATNDVVNHHHRMLPGQSGASSPPSLVITPILQPSEFSEKLFQPMDTPTTAGLGIRQTFLSSAHDNVTNSHQNNRKESSRRRKTLHQFFDRHKFGKPQVGNVDLSPKKRTRNSETNDSIYFSYVSKFIGSCFRFVETKSKHSESNIASYTNCQSNSLCRHFNNGLKRKSTDSRIQHPYTYHKHNGEHSVVSGCYRRCAGNRCSSLCYYIVLFAIIWRLCCQLYSLQNIPLEAVPLNFSHLMNNHSAQFVPVVDKGYVYYLTSNHTDNKRNEWLQKQRQIVARHVVLSSNNSNLFVPSPALVDLNKQITQRNRIRANRSRPPPQLTDIKTVQSKMLNVPSSSSTNDLWITRRLSAMDIVYSSLQKREKANDVNGKSHDWHSLCSRSSFTSRSRVVITGMLTIPAASMMALLISTQCNTSSIIGVDSMLPNLQKDIRIQAMDTYQQLKWSIPNLQLIVPNVVAGLNVLKGAQVGELSSLDWLIKTDPTHIIHFEPHSSNTVIHDSLRMTNSNEFLYQVRRSTLTTEQLLLYMYQKHLSVLETNKKTSRSKQRRPVRFLFVSTTQKPIQNNLINNYDDLIYQQYTPHLISKLLKALIESYNSLALKTLRLNNKTVSSYETMPAHIINIPEIYGPNLLFKAHNSLYTNFNSRNKSITNPNALHIDDVMVILLRSMKHTKEGLVQSSIDYNSICNNTEWQNQRQEQLNDYEQYVRYPYGETMMDSNSNISNVGSYRTTVETFHELYGIHKPIFPCASSCVSPSEGIHSHQRTCLKSRFDDVIPISVQASEGCTFVLFMMNFSNAVSELYEPSPDEQETIPSLSLCRIAFVSPTSKLVRASVGIHENEQNGVQYHHQLLQKENGQLKSNGWTLIWVLPKQEDGDEEVVLTEMDRSLLLIDPKRFFAGTVTKCMYTSVRDFAEPPDSALIRILNGIDRIAIPKHAQKVYRSGLKIFRFEERPAQNSRTVLFFAADVVRQPKDLWDYYSTHIRSVQNDTTQMENHIGSNHMKQQLQHQQQQNHEQFQFYDEVSYYVVEDDHYRPEYEIQITGRYDTFPFRYLSNALWIHDLHNEEYGRLFRCDWYNEHLFWNDENNRKFTTKTKQGLPPTSTQLRHGIEVLSLSYLLGKYVIKQTLGNAVDPQNAWVPFLEDDDDATDSINDEGSRSTSSSSSHTSRGILQNQRGSDLYVRFLTRPTSSNNVISAN